MSNAQHLKRVGERIGNAIMDFFNFLDVGDRFYADDLRKYVELRVGYVAPGSPDRVLRDYRQKGYLNYTVVSRSESYYRKEVA